MMLTSILLLAATPADAPKPVCQPIAFAGGGGLREWRRAGDDALYVRDRNERWYRVTLTAPYTGPIPPTGPITYTTDNVQRFDCFSSLTIGTVNPHRYGVRAIQRVERPAAG